MPESSRIKFNRALAHLEVLDKAVKGFEETQPNRVPGEFDANSGKYVFRRQEASTFDPLLWSPIIGDIVHNLSACLDHLAWELVGAFDASKRSTRTMFPIFEEEPLYDRNAPQKLRGIDPLAQAAIKRLQPFARGPRFEHPSEHALMLLYRLEQRDKHQSLVVTAEVLPVKLMGLPPHIYVGPSGFIFNGGNAHAVLATFDPSGPPEPYVGVYLETVSQAWFADDGPAGSRPVVRTLRDIARHIDEQVFPALRSFLG